MIGPEILYGVGVVVLLAALIFGVTRASRRRNSRAADEATRRNFYKR